MSAELVLQTIEARMQDLDWENMHDVNVRGHASLRDISRPALLGQMFAYMLKSDELINMCERFVHFSKFVLYMSKANNFRIRLHVFGDKYIQEAHNHRYTFTSRILHGQYIHFIHGSEDRMDDKEAAFVPQPLLVQHQTAGTCYSLHHSTIHSDYAEPNSVSLVLTGPSKRDSFRVVDKTTNEVRFRFGINDARYQPNKGEMPFTREEMFAKIKLLNNLGVISSA